MKAIMDNTSVRHFCFLGIIIIIISKAKLQERRERASEPPCTSSLPSGYKGQSCADLKVGASSRSHTQIQGPKRLHCACCFPGQMSRELGQKWSIEQWDPEEVPV